MPKYNVKGIIFSSSCTVYGQPTKENLPVTENAPIQKALSPYGNTKQINEEIIQDYIHSGAPIKSIILRYFNPIGAHPTAFIGELPNGVPMNLIPFVTQTAIGIRKQLKIFGHDYNTPDKTCIRDYIYVVDLAKAHVKAMGCGSVQHRNRQGLVDAGSRRRFREGYGREGELGIRTTSRG